MAKKSRVRKPAKRQKSKYVSLAQRKRAIEDMRALQKVDGELIVLEAITQNIRILAGLTELLRGRKAMTRRVAALISKVKSGEGVLHVPRQSLKKR